MYYSISSSLKTSDINRGIRKRLHISANKRTVSKQFFYRC